MIKGFWKSVSRANAFLFSLAALLVLMFVLVWSLRPFGTEGIRLRGGEVSGSFRTDHPERKNSAYLIPQKDSNPFHSEYVEQVNDQLAWAESIRGGDGPTDDEKVAPKTDPNVKNESPDQDAIVQDEPTAPPPRVMNLVYRGMIKNLDGTVMALVEKADSGVSEYYQSGSRIGWGSLVEFSRNSAEFAADGRTNSLPRGVVVELVEGVQP